MALRLGPEGRPDFTPHLNLRKDTVVKKLITQGRIPFLVRTGEAVICFIPPGKNTPSETHELGIDDAKRIAAIRDQLQYHH